MVVADGSLASVHRDLVAVLARLDSLDCPAAAAHLGSAIDAIEHALALPRSTRTFATQMRRAFGDRAEQVASLQLEAAAPAVFRVWSRILADLRTLK